mmetsp:Transcript_62415/g.135264  ORF Transcript_62415/g.135264 Transcript_62415/m.135264 type:complete len:323 (+) Transcript_62415:888-1856(+)
MEILGVDIEFGSDPYQAGLVAFEVVAAELPVYFNLETVFSAVLVHRIIDELEVDVGQGYFAFITHELHCYVRVALILFGPREKVDPPVVEACESFGLLGGQLFFVTQLACHLTLLVLLDRVHFHAQHFTLHRHVVERDDKRSQQVVVFDWYFGRQEVNLFVLQLQVDLRIGGIESVELFQLLGTELQAVVVLQQVVDADNCIACLPQALFVLFAVLKQRREIGVSFTQVLLVPDFQLVLQSLEHVLVGHVAATLLLVHARNVVVAYGNQFVCMGVSQEVLSVDLHDQFQVVECELELVGVQLDHRLLQQVQTVLHVFVPVQA